MAPEDMTPGELDRRLSRLESKVDGGFEALHARIISTSSTFVRADLYVSERDHTRDEIDGVRKLAMWAIGLVCSVAVGAIIIGIVNASGAVQ